MSACKRGDPSCTQKKHTHGNTTSHEVCARSTQGHRGRTRTWLTWEKQQPSLGNDFLSTLGRGFSIQFAPAECFTVIRLEAWHEACGYGSAPLRADRYWLAPTSPNSPFTQFQFQFQSTLLGWLFYIRYCQSINTQQKSGCNSKIKNIDMFIYIII